MISEGTVETARRIIENARIKGQGEIEFDAVLHDLKCTFTRSGDSITIVVLCDLGNMICCYQYTPLRWRRPAEQQTFLAFSRELRALQQTLEKRLNAPAKSG